MFISFQVQFISLFKDFFSTNFCSFLDLFVAIATVPGFHRFILSLLFITWLCLLLRFYCPRILLYIRDPIRIFFDEKFYVFQFSVFT